MNWRYFFITIFAFSLIWIPVKCQDRSDGLEIGDVVQSAPISVENTQQHWTRLSDFRGKLVILDFFSYFCSACIEAIPEMEALQHKYAGRIQVIMVTPSTRKQLDGLRRASKLFRETTLPMIVEDTTLSKMFPARTFPTHVWIDEKGVVREITNGQNTTEDEIDKFLSGENVSLPVKRETMDIDLRKPLFLEGNGRQLKNISSYSIFAHSLNVGAAGGVTDFDSATHRITRMLMFNLPILKLYERYYNYKFPHSRFSTDRGYYLMLTDTTRFISPRTSIERDKWRIANTYTYEISVPPGALDFLYKKMKEDLDDYFMVKTEIKVVRVPCLILYSVHKGILKTKGGKSETPHSSLDGLPIRYRNVPFNLFVQGLQNILPGLTPILDETGIKGNVDMDINAKLDDIEGIRKELLRYGIGMKYKIRRMRMVVIRDRISENESLNEN